MSDETRLNTEAHQQLDERVRDIELNQVSINSSIKSINDNIGDMKVMFQKFTSDNEKISSKADAVERVEKVANVLGSKYDELYKKVILVEHTCNMCSINRVNDCITSMSEKINKIELSLDEIKGDKKKFSGFWNSITQTIVTIVILYLLYIVATNIQTSGNIIANPPDVKKKSEMSFITEASANSFYYTSKKGKPVLKMMSSHEKGKVISVH